MLHIGYTEEKQLYYIWFKERIRIICVSLSRKVKSRQGEGGEETRGWRGEGVLARGGQSAHTLSDWHIDLGSLII